MKNNSFDYLAIEPITGPIPPKRQAAKRHYGVHPYFTRRSYNVVQEYIKRFTQHGDLVVDPFGGSGVTAIEALILRRRSVHIDINPLANFIAKCIAISPVDIDALDEEFKRVEKECRTYIRYLAYLPDVKVEDSPIEDWYPQGVKLPNNADRGYVHELFSPRQLRALAILRASIMNTKDEKIRDLLLLIFSGTLAKCNLTFLSAKNRKESRGGSSIFSVYAYFVGKKPVELDVWEQFDLRYQRLIKAKKETNELIGSFFNKENAVFIKGDATNLQEIFPDESVDYVYTDPPYGANIAYLDLSTMWNAWLGFTIEESDRIAEVIEGGDLQKTKQDYTERLQKSIFEIFRILKFNRWFSVVFAHKDPLYWDTIIKAAEACGFEYSNTSVQPVGVIWSMHKKKNPLKVISGELVINFKKKQRPRALAVTQVGIEIVDFILNSAELSIVQRENGASTDEIYEDLIPKLIENGLLSELKDRISDITPLLGDKFEYNHQSCKWLIPPNTKLGSFVPLETRIRYYIESFLNQCARRDVKATLEMIWADVIPMLKNGDQPSNQTLLVELNKIAEPYEGQFYMLKKEIQRELFDYKEIAKRPSEDYILPAWDVSDEYKVEHNEIIYRLAILGNAIGYKSLVGFNERIRSEDADKLSKISLKKLPTGISLSRYSRKKVEQIDLIWFDNAGFPAYAFEVEKTSAITTAIERFIELLKISLKISGKIVIVCPSSRHSKLDEVLSQSAFIGTPMYMENKIKYLYFYDIIDLYNVCQKEKFSIETIAVEIRKLLRSPLST